MPGHPSDTPGTPYPKPNDKSGLPSNLELEAMRVKLQAEIDDLKAQLEAKNRVHIDDGTRPIPLNDFKFPPVEDMPETVKQAIREQVLKDSIKAQIIWDDRGRMNLYGVKKIEVADKGIVEENIRLKAKVSMLMTLMSEFSRWHTQTTYISKGVERGTPEYHELLGRRDAESSVGRRAYDTIKAIEALDNEGEKPKNV